MTQQESFKKRVRERMAKTGERYSAARAALLAARPLAERQWVSQPEMSDAAVRKATGKGWNQWCEALDAWPGHDDGHTAIARYLRDELGVDAWWAQAVTGGYERITGRRLPGQMPDGTFTANKSKTVRIDRDALRAALLDDAARADLFPEHETTLRSRSTSKDVRLGIGSGVALISLTETKTGTKVSVQHGKLPHAESVPEWKFYWGEWLDALAS